MFFVELVSRWVRMAFDQALTLSHVQAVYLQSLNPGRVFPLVKIRRRKESNPGAWAGSENATSVSTTNRSKRLICLHFIV